MIQRLCRISLMLQVPICMILFTTIQISAVLKKENSAILQKLVETIVSKEKRCLISYIGMPAEYFEHSNVPTYLPTKIFSDAKFWANSHPENLKCELLLFGVTENQLHIIKKFLNENIEDWNYYGQIIFVYQFQVISEIIETFFFSEKIRKTKNVIQMRPFSKEAGFELWSHWIYSYDKIRRIGSLSKRTNSLDTTILYPEKFENLHNFPLVVKAFPHAPTSYGRYTSNGSYVGVHGSDVLFIKALASRMNFRIMWEHPGPELWGSPTEYGNYTGIVGQIANEDGDIGVAMVFMTISRKKFVMYTSPYTFESACVMTPAPRELPTWLSVTNTFTILVWEIAMAVIVLCCLILSSIEWISHRYLKTNSNEFSKGWAYVIGAFSDQSMKVFGTSSATRFLSVVIGLMAFVFSLSFSGNLTAFLTVKSYEAPITSLAELDASGYPIQGYSKLWLTVFGESPNQHLRNLAKRYSHHTGGDPSKSVVDRKGTFVENLLHLKYIQAKLPTNKEGHTPIRIQEECLESYMIAAILNLNSPLKETIDRVIMNMHSGGLFPKFARDSIAYKSSDDQHEKIAYDEENIESDSKALFLSHLLGAFAVLGLGILIASICMAVEICIAK